MKKSSTYVYGYYLLFNPLKYKIDSIFYQKQLSKFENPSIYFYYKKTQKTHTLL